MPNMYTQLGYEEYKALEKAMRETEETVHETTDGFYHKSIRLPIGADLVMEFHGPLVKAAEAQSVEDMMDEDFKKAK